MIRTLSSRSLTVAVLGLVLAVVSPGSDLAVAGSDFTYTLTSIGGGEDSTQTATVLMDASDEIDGGVTVAVCNDETVVEPLDGRTGPDIDFEPFFSGVNVSDDGDFVTLAFLFGSAGTLPAEDGLAIAEIDYLIVGSEGDTAPLDFCDAGVPLVENTVFVGGTEYLATRVDGVVSVGDSIVNDDLDEGESVFFAPEGGETDPVAGPTVEATNTGGGDDQEISVTVDSGDTNPDAGGYEVFDTKITVETTMDDGDFFMTLTVPFSADDLGDADPLDVDLTFYDTDLEEYVLAVAANTENSPGFDDPVGDRSSVDEGDVPELSTDLGDYGVYWDPDAEMGFVWANVDHTTEFAAGLLEESGPSFRRGDVDGSGAIFALIDAVYLLEFGFTNGPAPPCEHAADVDNSGAIFALVDAVYLLEWGFTNGPAPPAPGPTDCGVDPEDDEGLTCETSPEDCAP